MTISKIPAATVKIPATAAIRRARTAQRPRSERTQRSRSAQAADAPHHLGRDVDAGVTRQAGHESRTAVRARNFSASSGEATKADSTSCCWSESSWPSM